jgi:hypothetical protein
MSAGDGESLINEINSFYEGQMPPECFQLLKRFTLCKLENDEEIKKSKGTEFYRDYLTDPFSRVDGCKNEYNSYTKCYDDFYRRYIDLKNYVAEIEGKPLPFNKKLMQEDYARNRSYYNYGLNKF